jgi:hypothetical protein
MTEIPTTMFTDLVSALGDLENVAKTGDVNAGQRRYKFMEFSEMLKAARPVLRAHGFAFSQKVYTNTDTGHHEIETILVHKSGGTWASGPMVFDAQANVQVLGSLISYLKRYQGAALLGLAGQDDDDDGQHAVQAVQQARRSPQQDREQYGQTKPVHRAQASPDDPANQLWATPPPRPAALDDTPRSAASMPDPGSTIAASEAQIRRLHAFVKVAAEQGQTDKDTIWAWVKKVLRKDDDWSRSDLTSDECQHMYDKFEAEGIHLPARGER